MELFRQKITARMVDLGEKEKIAAMTMLSDLPSTWPSELTAALYKQHTFLGKYNVTLDIKAEDEGSGYLYGSFHVRPGEPPMPPGEAADGSGMSGGGPGGSGGVPAAGAMGGQTQPMRTDDPVASIPAIVAGKKAYPFDTFIDSKGKFLPLTEGRLSAIMYSSSPEMSLAPPEDLAAAERQVSNFGDTSSNGPGRGGGGMDGESTFNRGKTASAEGSIFEHVEPSKEKLAAVFNAINDDDILSGVAQSKGSFGAALIRASDASKRDDFIEKVASVDLEDEVAILTKVGGGYKVKTASGESIITHASASILPTDALNNVMHDGFAILTGNNVGLRQIEKLAAATTTVEAAGVYELFYRTKSASVKAVVLPMEGLLTGTPYLGNLVMSEDGVTWSGELVGQHIDTQGDLRKYAAAPVPGQTYVGIFHRGDDLHVSEILTCDYSTSGAHGLDRMTDANTGESVGFVKTAAFKIPKRIDDVVHVPESFFWMKAPVKSSDSLQFCSDSDEALEKIARMRGSADTCTLEHSQGEYFFFGENIPEDVRGEGFTKTATALWLARFGDTEGLAKEKLAEAAEAGYIEFLFSGEVHSEVVKTASVLDADFVEFCDSLDVDYIVKVAAALDSVGGDTVDAVLSLGFINPENTAQYIEMIPKIEESLTSLSELLIGTRLGLPDVPESAVKSAVSSVDRALMGLKKLQIRNETELAM